MILKIKLFLLFISFISLYQITYAQFSIFNRIEYQVGNLPDMEPRDRTNIFDQLNLKYFYKSLLVGLKAEAFSVSGSEAKYAKLSQRYLYYQIGNFEVQLGNFYEILGKGLLLRTYEIPGTTYEDGASRLRYGFYKDMDGVLLKYYAEFLQAKILFGNPLEFGHPPDSDNSKRRPNLVYGGELNIELTQYLKPGILFLQQQHDNNIFNFGGLNISGNVLENGQYYFEYVQDVNKDLSLFQSMTDERKKTQHALYGSINYSFDLVSFSLEYKDYHDFKLNFNDPPTLVREHYYTLLNRSTHTAEPLDERGIQFEGIFNFEDLNTSTINYSWAKNEISTLQAIFQEYYGDFNYYFNDYFRGKVFIDWADDQMENIYNRYTFGLFIERFFINFWSFGLDFQFQIFERKYNYYSALNHSTKNFMCNIDVAKSPNLSFSFLIEASNDPLEMNTLLQLKDTKYKYWKGLSINYKINQNNNVILFCGERRGGKVCAGGICYQILPFKGFELRLNSIF